MLSASLNNVARVGAPGWFLQLSICFWLRSWSQLCGLETSIGLCADSTRIPFEFLSLPLSLPPPCSRTCSHAFSLSKMNTKLKKRMARVLTLFLQRGASRGRDSLYWTWNRATDVSLTPPVWHKGAPSALGVSCFPSL